MPVVQGVGNAQKEQAHHMTDCQSCAKAKWCDVALKTDAFIMNLRSSGAINREHVERLRAAIISYCQAWMDDCNFSNRQPEDCICGHITETGKVAPGPRRIEPSPYEPDRTVEAPESVEMAKSLEGAGRRK